ncbi:hypothetical protein VNO78_19772 [Psophocarpus tetragonolobus]|uniref:Uncharacterized protein n=1 Tax=Psophocarpus tetragonolobus TaxID=3891 RepID=A0AAN9XG49_PSOTE
MLSLVVVQNYDKIGHIERKRVRCYAIAPAARCMSLNLAVRYADTATPLEDIFKSLFCLPCLLCLRCMKDTYTPEEKMLKDPRRLYAPGRLYHIVKRKPFNSKHAYSFHKSAFCLWQLQLMKKKHNTLEIPANQIMERQETLARHNEEYKEALERAKTLDVPHGYAPASQYGTFDEEGKESSRKSQGESSLGSTTRSTVDESWDEMIEGAHHSNLTLRN